MDPAIKKDMENQGYRFVGEHSAVKICLWCKQAILDKDVCYKNTFYGIQSHRCLQSSVSVFNCLHRCEFCWRTLEHTSRDNVENPNSPKEILDGLIIEQKKFLQGLKGNKNTNPKKFEEAMDPKHVAISLAGDATMYPLLPEFIDEVKSRGMTSFVVTNGLQPEMLKKLLDHNPTQLYVTLPAPDKETYLKVCKPLVSDGWERLMDSLKILQKFPRSTVRLTVFKTLNMDNVEGYASILKDLNIKFIEIKAAMPMGYAQYRLAYEDMPRHNEIIDFAKKLCELTGLKIIEEKVNSRVVLLMKEDSKDRKLNL